MSEARLIRRGPESSSAGPERQREVPASGSAEPQSQITTAEREVRRERLQRLEAWNSACEEMSQVEVYDHSQSLTKEALRLRKKLQAPGANPNEARTQQLRNDWQRTEDRLRVIRDVRAEKNGWKQETTADLQLRATQLQTELAKVERQLSAAVDVSNRPESRWPAEYRQLPEGLEPSDVTVVFAQRRISVVNDLETLTQLLAERGVQ